MNEEDLTSVQILKKDRDFLRKLKQKQRLVSMWAVIEKFVDIIKKHKLEEELK